MATRRTLYAAALHAAATNSPDTEAAVTTYTDHARRPALWRRAAARYMRLPHNRAIEWAAQRPAVALPLSAAVVAASIALGRR